MNPRIVINPLSAFLVAWVTLILAPWFFSHFTRIEIWIDTFVSLTAGIGYGNFRISLSFYGFSEVFNFKEYSWEVLRRDKITNQTIFSTLLGIEQFDFKASEDYVRMKLPFLYLNNLFTLGIVIFLVRRSLKQKRDRSVI